MEIEWFSLQGVVIPGANTFRWVFHPSEAIGCLVRLHPSIE